MDWKERQPGEVAIYFHCQTQLVATFRALYGEILSFEGNRAIVLDLAEEMPVEEVGHCIGLALTFGLLWLDADLDGYQDIALANGHLEPYIQDVQEGISYAQPLQLLRNTGAGGVGRFLVGRGGFGDSVFR